MLDLSPPPRFYLFDESIFEVLLHEPVGLDGRIPEALVHDLWQGQSFDPVGFATTEGAPVAVLDPGRPNADRGPDFHGARLHIGGRVWHGDVEIHVTSKDWFGHGHHADARYNSTVLHVTLLPDVWTGGLLREDGSVLPEVVLLPRLRAPLRKLLHRFRTRAPQTLPCAEAWPETPEPQRAALIRSLAYERLRERRAELEDHYRSAPDLDALLYVRLMAALGYSKNADAMTSLAQRLPLPLLRTIEDTADREALLLGTAGLLPAPADLLDADRSTADYAMDLRERYDRLRHRHDVAPMERATWSFFRLRPANFPTLRIAQAAAMLGPGGLLHEEPMGIIREALRAPDPLRALRKRLRAEPSAFWHSHVRPDRPSNMRSGRLGRSRADRLIADAIIPIALLDAAVQAAPEQEATVRSLLERLPAATDEVVRPFTSLGQRIPDALTGQGLHQLYRTRCQAGRCLTCPIGRRMLAGA